MSYSRRRLLRTNENIPNFLPQDVSKHQVVKKTRINSTTQAPETGNTHRPRTDKRFSDSDDLGLFSAHVDDIEDSTHSFVSLFLSSRQTPKPSTSAIMEIRSSTEPTKTIYPWLNTTNIDNGDTIRDTNKKDKKTKSNKQEKEEKRKAKKESRNKHENLDSLNKKVRGTRNKWKKEQREKIKEQVQKICTGDFIGAQGKRCCQKSIKCFGDLPQLIDEIETYNNSEDQDDLQRQHVCQHIKNSMLCMGHAMALPVCKSSVTFVHRKLNDTLSDVTQFHTESCQTGSSPPPIIPTTATTSVTSSSGGIGNHRGFKHHTHEHTNYAAIIGGVAGGAILIFLIILILLLLRKNKSKRPSEFSGKDSDGGMTLSNGSSRYKTHIGLSRKQSEVYAEIDESSMHSNQSFSDKRPLPSAPSNGPVSSDNTGYLTPRSSKDELGLINDRDSGGYHVLQKEPSRKPSVDAYEKLQNEEGEYIEPTHTRDSRVRIPSQKAPQNNTSNISKPNGDDNYHMYFVLEKENAVHV